MSKPDLSTALVDAGGGHRSRSAKTEPAARTKAAPKKAPGQANRVATKPITVHYRGDVRDQLKILAVEQGLTMQTLVAEGFNMLFAKYGKPEIAPATEQGS